MGRLLIYVFTFLALSGNYCTLTALERLSHLANALIYCSVVNPMLGWPSSLLSSQCCLMIQGNFFPIPPLCCQENRMVLFFFFVKVHQTHLVKQLFKNWGGTVSSYNCEIYVKNVISWAIQLMVSPPERAAEERAM